MKPLSPVTELSFLQLQDSIKALKFALRRGDKDAAAGCIREITGEAELIAMYNGIDY